MYTYPHISELGGCLARPVAMRMGYEPVAPPTKIQTLFDAGNKWEDIVIERLMSRGWVITDRQQCVYISVASDVQVATHIDGKITQDYDSTSYRGDIIRQRILEVKSMNQDTYDDFVAHGWDASLNGLMEKYKWQASCYMVAHDLELMMVGVNRASDESNPDYHILYREIPWWSKDQIVARVQMIEQLASLGHLVECTKRSYPCPVWYITNCQAADDTDDYLEALALEIVKNGEIKAAAEAEDKRLRQITKTHMGNRTKVRTEAATISISQGKVSKYLDEPAMLEDGIEVEKYRREKRGDPYLSVRRRKVNDASTTDESA